MAAQPAGVSTTPPSLVSSANLLRVHSVNIHSPDSCVIFQAAPPPSPKTCWPAAAHAQLTSYAATAPFPQATGTHLNSKSNAWHAPNRAQEKSIPNKPEKTHTALLEYAGSSTTSPPWNPPRRSQLNEPRSLCFYLVKEKREQSISIFVPLLARRHVCGAHTVRALRRRRVPVAPSDESCERSEPLSSPKRQGG